VGKKEIKREGQEKCRKKYREGKEMEREIEDEMSERKQGWINNHNNPKRTTEKNEERQKRGRSKERRKRITLYKEKIGERE
jgi:hypothetical protein